PSGTTTGPAFPDGALWMCAALAPVTPFKLRNFQQTFVPLIVILAVPVAFVDDLGASSALDMYASKSSVPDANAIVGTAIAARTATATAMRVRKALLLVPRVLTDTRGAVDRFAGSRLSAWVPGTGSG